MAALLLVFATTTPVITIFTVFFEVLVFAIEGYLLFALPLIGLMKLLISHLLMSHIEQTHAREQQLKWSALCGGMGIMLVAVIVLSLFPVQVFCISLVIMGEMLCNILGHEAFWFPKNWFEPTPFEIVEDHYVTPGGPLETYPEEQQLQQTSPSAYLPISFQTTKAQDPMVFPLKIESPFNRWKASVS